MEQKSPPLRRMLALFAAGLALLAGSADGTRDPLAPPAGRLVGTAQRQDRLDRRPGSFVEYRVESFAYETPVDREAILDFYATSLPAIGLEFACEPRAAARRGGFTKECGRYDQSPFDWQADLLFRDPRAFGLSTITVSVAPGPGRLSLVAVKRVRVLRESNNF
ncbi:MAG TPA: hypothetical protein VGE07_24940 [Herpetosiphonaceae bacterium]